MAHCFTLVFLLGAAAFFLGHAQAQSQAQALRGKDERRDDDDSTAEYCPPPPCPSPPPASPPPPPPPCKSCDKDTCKKDDCGDDDKEQPKAIRGKAAPKDDDDDDDDDKVDKGIDNDDGDKNNDDKDDDDDKLTDNDVRNLNDLLRVQFVLNDIFLRAILGGTGLGGLGGPGQRQQQQQRRQDENLESLASSSRKTAVFQSINVPSLPVMVPDMLTEFSAISIAQLNSMLSVLGDQAVPRPQNLNVSGEAMSLAVNRAFNGSLHPDYSIDSDPTKLLLAVQTLGPALAASVATDVLPNLESNTATSLVAGILPVLASQDASMRTVLYSQRESRVEPYNYTVGEFMQRTSTMAANLQLSSDDDSEKSGDDDDSENNVLGRNVGDILRVNVLGAGVAMPARGVLDLLSSLFGIVSIDPPLV